jgi:hypothetical protein
MSSFATEVLIVAIHPAVLLVDNRPFHGTRLCDIGHAVATIAGTWDIIDALPNVRSPLEGFSASGSRSSALPDLGDSVEAGFSRPFRSHSRGSRLARGSRSRGSHDVASVTPEKITRRTSCFRNSVNRSAQRRASRSCAGGGSRVFFERSAPKCRSGRQDVDVQLRDERSRAGRADRREHAVNRRAIVDVPVALLADPLDEQPLRLQGRTSRTAASRFSDSKSCSRSSTARRRVRPRRRTRSPSR